jgi:hypothetical protein
MPGHSARSRAWSTVASVSTKANMVAMFGWIMPEPLAMPSTERRRRASTATVLGGQVGGEDRLRERRRRRRAAAPRPPWGRPRVPVHRHALADHAGGGGEDLLRPREGQGRGGQAGEVLVVPGAGVAVGAVGVAGVHDQRAHRVTGCVPGAVAGHARRLDQVLGGDHRPGERVVADDEPEVGLARRLDAGGDAGEPEPERGASRPLSLQRKPDVSAQPNARLNPCTAWPAAPLPRLSIAHMATTVPLRSSQRTLRTARSDPATALVCGSSSCTCTQWIAVVEVAVALEQLGRVGRPGRGAREGGREDAAGHRHQHGVERDRTRSARARGCGRPCPARRRGRARLDLAGVAVAAGHLVGPGVLVRARRSAGPGRGRGPRPRRR